MKRIPYATQWITKDDSAAIKSVLGSANLTQGPEVDEFEKRLAEYCGAKYAVAVNSGTSALHVACLAAGIKKGDEVITSPITFVASANCALYCGARPVFADVDRETVTLDPVEVEKKINKHTKVIIPVHFAGHPCDMSSIAKIARKKGLVVIEDAAHALGARYKAEGKWYETGSCSHSDMTILSFHAVKHITTGEGGAILTNSREYYDKMLLFRSHGITRNNMESRSPGPWYYEMHELGYNYRLTDIQCALGISQLKRAGMFLRRRMKLASLYDNAFGKEGIHFLKEKEGYQSARHLYVILVKDRDAVFKRLRDDYNITVNVHYIPVYQQPYYQRIGYKKCLCPNAENYYRQAISIPMYPKLSASEIKYVIQAVGKAVKA